MKLTCPNNKKHKRFVTTAHEVHDWIVDNKGEFVDDKGCTEVTHEPDSHDTFQCAVCNADAMVKDD